VISNGDACQKTKKNLKYERKVVIEFQEDTKFGNFIRYEQ